MRITRLQIENFKALGHLEMKDLGRTVIVAGQNGAGKSCVLDAIRLVKSIYGGYQASEYTMWFGEQQIQVDADPREFIRLLRNKNQPMRLSIEFELEESEKEFLRANVDDLSIVNAWRQITPIRTKFASGESLATQQRLHKDQVAGMAAEDADRFRQEIASRSFAANITLVPGQRFEVTPSVVLEYAFSNFRPEQLGIIEFHSADRRYEREAIASVDISAQEQTFQAHALYNQKEKYRNFKGQLAGQFVRELLAERAGVSNDRRAGLTQTLRELFATFFPGKEFVGPVPTEKGMLLFPVKTLDGKEHDIDDLSSGEKEVLYGYLRLRNATPKNSVVLIDEPELHLNPRLVRGLGRFYHDHLTVPLNCQLWLITHSDILLREAVGRPGFSVFYVHAAHAVEHGTNQASVAEKVQAALIPLIEELAGFNPEAKVVLLEGGGEAKFDAEMIRELFPLFAEAVNLVSVGPKWHVNGLHLRLEEVTSVAELGAKFYSISDRDSEEQYHQAVDHALVWDAYHIENYLLVPEYIHQAVSELHVTRGKVTATLVEEWLVEAARLTMPGLIRALAQRQAAEMLLAGIELRTDKTAPDVASDLHRAASSVPARIESIVRERLDQATVATLVNGLETRFREDLASGQWVKSFQGRAILKRFVGLARLSISYEVLRYAIIVAMKRSGYEPPGMKAVLDRIHAVETRARA